MNKRQQQSYKLFIGASSLALLATAIAPVTYAQEVQSGKEVTKSINVSQQTITRAEVVKMIGSWLSEKGFTVPADYATKPRFNDIPATDQELLKYAALLHELDIVRGYPNGDLGVNDKMRQDRLAVILVRAYDLVYQTDLMSYVASLEPTKRTKGLDQESQPAIHVFDYFGISTAADFQKQPKAPVTKEQFEKAFDQLMSLIVADREAPILSYDGETTITVQEGTQFELPNVQATDNVDEQLTIKTTVTDEEGRQTTAVNTDEPGTYTITYDTKDVAGNDAESFILTIVVEENEANDAQTKEEESKTVEDRKVNEPQKDEEADDQVEQSATK